MDGRGRATVVLILLWQCLGLQCGLIVLRSSGGDLFQNPGAEQAYCAQRNARCSQARLSSPDGNCDSNEASDSACSSCVCNPSERYNEDLDSCVVPGKDSELMMSQASEYTSVDWSASSTISQLW